MATRLHRLAALALAAVIAGCGGSGGGTSAPAPPSSNPTAELTVSIASQPFSGLTKARPADLSWRCC